MKAKKVILRLCIGVVIAGAIFFGINLKNSMSREFELKWEQRKPGNLFSDEDFSIVRLEPGYTWLQVTEIYKEPLRKEIMLMDSENPNCINYFYTWTYPDFKVGFLNIEDKDAPIPKDPGEVFSITVTSNKYPSFRGIKVGDSVDKVRKRYNNLPLGTFPYTSSKDCLIYECCPNYIMFDLLNKKVNKITISSML